MGAAVFCVCVNCHLYGPGAELNNEKGSITKSDLRPDDFCLLLVLRLLINKIRRSVSTKLDGSRAFSVTIKLDDDLITDYETSCHQKVSKCSLNQRVDCLTRD